MPESVILQGIDNEFDTVATEAAGKTNPLMIFLGLIIFMTMLLGLAAYAVVRTKERVHA